MEAIQNRPPGERTDEELIDVLIAISVVAKRLSEKLRTQLENEKAARRSDSAGRREE